MPYARKDLLTWQKGMYYHIYNRGARQITIFREQRNYLFTISKIKEYSRANDIKVIAYCLMPTHYHILTRQDGEKPAGFLPQSVLIVIQRLITKCTRTAARSLKEGFGQSLFKPVPICCSCVVIFTEILSKMGWSLTLPIGNIQIISSGSGNATGHL